MNQHPRDGLDAPSQHDAGDAEFFEMSLDHLCVAGFDGYWKRLNPSWTRTLGWTAEEMMSRPLIEFCHPDDRAAVISARQRLFAGLPIPPPINRYRCKDGTYRWFEWRSVSNVDRQLVYAVARDITAERQAREAHERMQRQLIVADRMASLGTLAGGVAHEINNPLAYVLANLEMIAEEIDGGASVLSPARAADCVQMAREALDGVERISKIVRSLKAFCRAEVERRAVIDVRPVIERSIDMAFNEIRHRARLVKDYGEIPLVEVDESRLGQVFVNLLVNAAQAILEGNTEGNEIRVVTSTDAAGRAVIELRDTGPGIPESAIPRVFDPFFTTKPIGGGTGLGLSICHGIVSGMNGEITAENGDGRGAVFRVVLPAAVTTSEAESPEPVSRTAVLVVDDVGGEHRRVLRECDVTVPSSTGEARDRIRA